MTHSHKSALDVKQCAQQLSDNIMKNTIINDAWRENLETKIIANDWYIVPIVIVGTMIGFTLLAGVENTFNVLAQFIEGIMNN